jgi:hypothetical protein
LLRNRGSAWEEGGGVKMRERRRKKRKYAACNGVPSSSFPFTILLLVLVRPIVVAWSQSARVASRAVLYDTEEGSTQRKSKGKAVGEALWHDGEASYIEEREKKGRTH